MFVLCASGLGEWVANLAYRRGVIMAKWRLKGCPRCGGDTFLDRESDGWFEHCLLCGYSHSLPVSVARALTGDTKQPLRGSGVRKLGVSQ